MRGRRTRARARAIPRAAIPAALLAFPLATFPLLTALPAAAAPSLQWSDWQLDAGAETRFDHNLNRAGRRAEEDWDVSYHPAVGLGRALQLDERTRLSARAEVEGAIHSRFDGLHGVEAGLRLSLVHKLGLGPAPWVRLSARGAYRHVQADQRSGPRFALGLLVGKRLTERLDAALGYRFNRHFGENGGTIAAAPGFPNDVFDQQFHEVWLEGRFLVTERLQATAGFQYRRGDFDSNARGNRFDILVENDVEAGALDRVFGGWVYRIDGNGYAPYAGLNYALADRWSLDLRYRFERGEGAGLDYRNHAVRAALLFRY